MGGAFLPEPEPAVRTRGGGGSRYGGGSAGAGVGGGRADPVDRIVRDLITDVKAPAVVTVEALMIGVTVPRGHPVATRIAAYDVGVALRRGTCPAQSGARGG